jgi:hypothetical protein
VFVVSPQPVTKEKVVQNDEASHQMIGASALTAAAAMVSAGPAALAAPAQVRPPAGITTQIVNYNSNKCLTIAGGGLGDNIKAVQYGCDLHQSRLWYFRY